jgi:GT2 family glycosyltransferase
LTVDLSVVVLAWNGLPWTERFVESVRAHTTPSYELIIVDNGSEPEAVEFARRAGDEVVLNESNLGFAMGMNQGLERASGRYVAFCNNDVRLPASWASRLVETAVGNPAAGIVVPALTAARNDVTVRSSPGEEVVVLPPFSPPPSAVVYLLPTALARDIGGWGEEYRIASGEDLDLAFKVWVNDRDIVFDERVLVEHEGKVTASQLGDWRSLWAANRDQFLDKWCARPDVPRLTGTDPSRFERNLATASAVAGWMRRYFDVRDSAARPRPASRRRVGRRLRRLARAARSSLEMRRRAGT